jgi:hypothetical protein
MIGNKMTTSSPTPVVKNPPKSSWVSGCMVTTLVILFAILGIYNLIFGSAIAYVFSSARMLSPATLAIVLIIACDSLIYFFLAFRIKRQHWLIFLSIVSCGLASPFLATPFTDKYRNGESSS